MKTRTLVELSDKQLQQVSGGVFMHMSNPAHRFTNQTPVETPHSQANPHNRNSQVRMGVHGSENSPSP